MKIKEKNVAIVGGKRERFFPKRRSGKCKDIIADRLNRDIPLIRAYVIGLSLKWCKSPTTVSESAT
jgi:hypothetical protein